MLPGTKALEPYEVAGISCRTGLSLDRNLAVRTAGPLRTEPWKLGRPGREIVSCHYRPRYLDGISGLSRLLQHLVQSVPVTRGVTDSRNGRWCHLEGAKL